MLRIQILHPTSRAKIFLGEPFENINQIGEALEDLDAEHDLWQALGSKPNHPIMFIEICEIYIEGDGMRYWMNELNIPELLH
jgi:hypothetical protein